MKSSTRSHFRFDEHFGMDFRASWRATNSLRLPKRALFAVERTHYTVWTSFYCLKSSEMQEKHVFKHKRNQICGSKIGKKTSEVFLPRPEHGYRIGVFLSRNGIRLTEKFIWNWSDFSLFSWCLDQISMLFHGFGAWPKNMAYLDYTIKNTLYRMRPRS